MRERDELDNYCKNCKKETYFQSNPVEGDLVCIKCGICQQDNINSDMGFKEYTYENYKGYDRMNNFWKKIRYMEANQRIKSIDKKVFDICTDVKKKMGEKFGPNIDTKLAIKRQLKSYGYNEHYPNIFLIIYELCKKKLKFHQMFKTICYNAVLELNKQVISENRKKIIPFEFMMIMICMELTNHVERLPFDPFEYLSLFEDFKLQKNYARNLDIWEKYVKNLSPIIKNSINFDG